MKLDTATFAFGYKVRSGGNTPNWGTSLGQSQINEYKINDYDGLNEIIKGMIYTSKSSDKISTKIGKGGIETFGNIDDSPIVLGSVFSKVKVNDVLIPNGKFILLITRDTAESHKGRLKLKYGPSNKFSDSSGSYTNEMFYASVRNALGLADKACWFVSELSVENQDVLKLKAIIVNKNGTVEYEDTKELHEAWSKLEPSFLEISDENTNAPNNFTPTQLILYGVPGSGKSYKIAKHLENLGINKDNVSQYTKRVVFHPEYTNADFIGQILPRSDASGNTISYPFVAGPFTQLLALAYTHKNQNFALIIEEINRGNAAAIFGELFQLLDRLDKDEEGSSNGYKYTSGWSSYPVTNDSINHAIFEAYMPKADDRDFAPFIPKENFEQYKENIGIRLPPNFSIFATMNTSDQNVFKLDNAFKRRFDLELIPNIFGDENGKLTAEEENQRDAEIEGFGFTWNNFRETVNEIITRPENEFDISSFSDRQIGCWFVKAEEKSKEDTNIKSELKIPRKTFLNKVLEYLWDDVCNGESEIFFNPDYKTLAELINAVEKENKTDIFSKDLQKKIDSKKKMEH